MSLNLEHPLSSEEFGEEIKKISASYNIRVKTDDSRWSSMNTFPIPEMQMILRDPQKYGTEAVTLTELGSDHFSQLVGGVIRKSSQVLPETTTILGMAPAPKAVKEMSFLGEYMSEYDHVVHRTYHELSHTIIFYEMVDALKEAFPSENLSDSIRRLDIDTGKLRRSDSPLSRLDKLNFYSQDELTYEDLAEALAIRLYSEEKWKIYKHFCSSKNPEAFSRIEKVINIMYSNVKQKQKLVDTQSPKPPRRWS